jgi:hypothetical protein
MKEKIIVEFSWSDVRNILFSKAGLSETSGTQYNVKSPGEAARDDDGSFVTIIQVRETKTKD